MSDTRRLPALDGLRTIAVGLVLVEHGAFSSSRLPPLPWPTLFSPIAPGPMGVRLFFVLSGWLITGILLRARDEAERDCVPRTQVWRAFLIRRALRILPLAYLAIAVAIAIDVPTVFRDRWWYLTYTSNVLNMRGSFLGLGHFWSLAIEEQFYLVWPAIVLFVPRGRMRLAMLATIGLAAITRAVLVAEVSEWAGYVLTVPRLDALAIGGVVALAQHQGQTVRTRTLAVASAVLIGGGAALPLSLSSAVSETGLVLGCAALIAAVANGWAQRLLTWTPLVSLGTISYGLYVWHFIVPNMVVRIEDRLGFHPEWPDPYGMTSHTVGALICATLSWWLFERPINALKRYAPYVNPQRRSRMLKTRS